MKNVLEMAGIAYFFAFCLTTAHADIETDQLFVTTKLKQAAQMDNARLDDVKKAWQLKQMKRTFMLLFNVPPHKLKLFLDQNNVIHAQKILLGDETRVAELTFALEKQRLEMLLTVLNAARTNELIPRIFDAYQESTRVLNRQEERNMYYAVGKGLERFAINDVLEIDSAFQDLFDSNSSLKDPVQIFRLSQLAGHRIVPVKDMNLWHETLLKIEPTLFLKGEDGEFLYPRLSRRVFSHPNYLYHYLRNKDPKDLPHEATEFIQEFERLVPMNERLKILPPLAWANIYAELLPSHPEIVEGVFSLGENKVFVDFYGPLSHLDQSHIQVSSQMIAEAYRERPEELTAAFRCILRKQGSFLNSDLNKLTPQDFIRLFQEGKIPLLTDSLQKVRVTREVIRSLEEQVLKSPDPLSQEKLAWAEKTVDRNLAIMDGLWSDLRLTTMRIDPKYMADAFSEENTQHITYVKGLLSKLFGEDYIVGLKALKVHIRELKRQATRRM